MNPGSLIAFLAFVLTMSSSLSCRSNQSQSGAIYDLKADGNYSLAQMSEATVLAIKSACNDPLGARDNGLSPEECYLIMAGSSVVESSWQPNKSCEAWGNRADPCCGLTQSRRGDARAVGLQCDPSQFNADGYRCNILTGLRNIGCKASDGQDCKVHSSDGSLHTGVKKHLGFGNAGALGRYIRDMQAVYHRQDVRSLFGISSGALRSWDAVFYGGRFSTLTPSLQAPEVVVPSQQSQPAVHAGPARMPSVPVKQNSGMQVPVSGNASEGWTDSYSKRRFPYCKSAASDPDRDGWGFELGRSCKIR